MNSADEEPTYDSCFDDLNVILSQSIQEPDPDPNLDSSSGSSTRIPRDEAAAHLPKDRGKTPRTSEIFRSVVAPAAGKPPLVGSGGLETPGSPQSQPEAGPAPEPTIPDVVLDRDRQIQDLASEEEDRLSEPHVSWSHVLLLSYSSAITLAMIWMFWTGRWSKARRHHRRPRTSRPPNPPPGPWKPPPSTPPPRIPAENLATLGKTIRLGDLEVTPLSVIAAPVELDALHPAGQTPT